MNSAQRKELRQISHLRPKLTSVHSLRNFLRKKFIHLTNPKARINVLLIETDLLLQFMCNYIRDETTAPIPNEHSVLCHCLRACASMGSHGQLRRKL